MSFMHLMEPTMSKPSSTLCWRSDHDIPHFFEPVWAGGTDLVWICKILDSHVPPPQDISLNTYTGGGRVSYMLSSTEAMTSNGHQKHARKDKLKQPSHQEDNWSLAIDNIMSIFFCIWIWQSLFGAQLDSLKCCLHVERPFLPAAILLMWLQYEGKLTT